MSNLPPPPRTFEEFSERFPLVRQAWDLLGDAGKEGPLDERTARLIKLGVAIGAMREGAVHSAARKALGQEIPPEALYQVVALAASVTGLPSAVAVYTWVRDVVEKGSASPGRGPRR
jgi:4-carboxymuconolactone decarboxylase